MKEEVGAKKKLENGRLHNRRLEGKCINLEWKLILKETQKGFKFYINQGKKIRIHATVCLNHASTFFFLKKTSFL